jgi:hypothetical protein
MIRKVKRFNTFQPTNHRPRTAHLSPEEDVVDIDGGDGDIDETLPADLWFRTRRIRERSVRAG